MNKVTEVKTCNKCELEQPLTNFAKNRRYHRATCNDCRKLQAKAYNSRANVKEHQKGYREQPEVRERNKQHQIRFWEKVAEEDIASRTTKPGMRTA